MTELCIRCGVLSATESGWPHCEDCYQAVCNEVHEAACDARDAVMPFRTWPDLLLRVVRPLVPSLRLEGAGVWRGDCPWCDDEGELCRSFYVYPTNRYHCFACGATGDAIAFLMHEEGFDFVQAVEWLAKEAGRSLASPS